MNLTPAQWLAIAIGMLGVLAAGGTQLDAVIGPVAAKSISAASALVSAMLAIPLSVMTGQSSIVRQVSVMPGVEPLKVNAQANSTLAALAVDPANDKIEVKPGAEAAVQRTASQ